MPHTRSPKFRSSQQPGTLVVTHTTAVGVLAGAVVKRGLKGEPAEVRFASARTLKAVLEEARQDGIGHIYVLGHRLYERAGEVLHCIRELLEFGVRVTWLGAPDFPDPSWPDLRKIVDLHVPSHAKNLVHAAAIHFKALKDGYVKQLWEGPLGEARADTTGAIAHDLAAAMVDRYWQYDDRKAAHDALETIAAATPYPAEMLKAVAVFRRYGPTHLTGKSEAVREVRRRIGLLKDHPNARVIIHGETGTGKEIAARLIHMGSPRAEQPFLAENCATLRGELLLSHLFGHEKGAFTGADRTREGLFEHAHGGTLFLDEIGELDLTAQAFLLRVLQEGKLRHVGGYQDIEVDVRVIAATHRDLRELVSDGSFREDLYYRLSALTLIMPPLRERPEDIPFVAGELLWDLWVELNPARKGRRPTLSPKARLILQGYDWPGNTRELQNVLTQALVENRLNGMGELLEERRRDRWTLPPAPAVQRPLEAEAPPAAGGPAERKLGDSDERFCTGEAPLDEVVGEYLLWLYRRHGTKSAVQRIAAVSQGRVERRLAPLLKL